MRQNAEDRPKPEIEIFWVGDQEQNVMIAITSTKRTPISL